jgi:aryl-alcohol dehydrogenase-like predicted oxidoreductase
MLSRREWLGLSLSAGASLVLTPALLRALQKSGGKLIQRAIPSSGEMLPVISFGARAADPAALKEVLKTLVDNGGKIVDVLHGGPAGEQGARAAASELGIQDQLFWTTPLSVEVPVLPGYDGPPLEIEPAAVRAALDARLAAFKVPKIDLVMVGTGVDVPTHLAALRELKKEGKVGYIGVHHLAFPPNAPMPPFGELESIMRNEQIDFVGTDYSVGDRRVEETILPLAQERKIAFMAYFPFDRGRLFKRIGTTPLPEWAAEFDAKTLGAVPPQVRPQPPGRYGGPRGDDQRRPHARQHRRRHRSPAERGDAEADGGAGRWASPRHRRRSRYSHSQSNRLPKRLRSCCPRPSWTATWVSTSTRRPSRS